MIDLFSEDSIDLLENLHIPNVYQKKSEAYKYWFRSLLHKIDSAIIFEGLPKGWNNDFFMFCLWARGFVVVFQTKRKELLKFGKDGVVFQPCTLSGKRDFYYQPSEVIIANPYVNLSNSHFKLGNKARLLKLTPDFLGVLDILDFYATKLAELSKSIDMSIINSKIGLIATASNEAQSATLKAIYDKLLKGEPLVVYDDVNKDSDEVMPRKTPFDMWIQELKKNYILTEQLGDLQTILDSFYTEIGLPVATEKKERLITSEANFASAQSQARISCWVETLKECLEDINKDFNINIEVSYACKNDNTGDRIRTEQETNPRINN